MNWKTEWQPPHTKLYYANQHSCALFRLTAWTPKKNTNLWFCYILTSKEMPEQQVSYNRFGNKITYVDDFQDISFSNVSYTKRCLLPGTSGISITKDHLINFNQEECVSDMYMTEECTNSFCLEIPLNCVLFWSLCKSYCLLMWNFSANFDINLKAQEEIADCIRSTNFERCLFKFYSLLAIQKVHLRFVLSNMGYSNYYYQKLCCVLFQ